MTDISTASMRSSSRIVSYTESVLSLGFMAVAVCYRFSLCYQPNYEQVAAYFFQANVLALVPTVCVYWIVSSLCGRTLDPQARAAMEAGNTSRGRGIASFSFHAPVVLATLSFYIVASVIAHLLISYLMLGDALPY